MNLILRRHLTIIGLVSHKSLFRCGRYERPQERPNGILGSNNGFDPLPSEQWVPLGRTNQIGKPHHRSSARPCCMMLLWRRIEPKQRLRVVGSYPLTTCHLRMVSESKSSPAPRLPAMPAGPRATSQRHLEPFPTILLSAIRRVSKTYTSPWVDLSSRRERLYRLPPRSSRSHSEKISITPSGRTFGVRDRSHRVGVRSFEESRSRSQFCGGSSFLGPIVLSHL